MVKYGFCQIICQICGSGCGVKTEIQRDKKWETRIIETKCAHYEFWIDLFTNDCFFNPYKDEIQFKTYSKCLECCKTISHLNGCLGFEIKQDFIVNQCHSSSALHEFRLSSNSSSDYLLNTVLYSFGLYGTLVKFISKKVMDHVELFVYAPVCGNQIQI